MHRQTGEGWPICRVDRISRARSQFLASPRRSACFRDDGVQRRIAGANLSVFDLGGRREDAYIGCRLGVGQMSDLTRCNYCTLKDFELVAARGGGEIVIRPAESRVADLFNTKSVDIFIHYPGDTEPTWCAWFMALTDKCAC